MIRKKFLSFAILLLTGVSVTAQVRMQINMKDGSVRKYRISDVQDISLVEMNETGTNGHEYVDLGLSVLWATNNIGAVVPEEYGDYFAWGETEPYYLYGHSKDNPCHDWKTGKEDGYHLASYNWCEGSTISFTKYCTDGDGYIDKQNTLQPCDDAATINWGGSWRMPSWEEMNELCCTCEWELSSKNGVSGFTVTGPNGNSIFLPLAGYFNQEDLRESGNIGMYWTNRLRDDRSIDAQELGLFSYGDNPFGTGAFPRHFGLTIRPVYCPK